MVPLLWLIETFAKVEVFNAALLCAQRANPATEFVAIVLVALLALTCSQEEPSSSPWSRRRGLRVHVGPERINFVLCDRAGQRIDGHRCGVRNVDQD